MSEKKLQSFEDLFGKNNEPKELAGVNEIAIEQLKPFHDHPFKLYEGKRLLDMIDSIKEMGVMVPIIVRKLDVDVYEILSGHNRVNAAKLAGLCKVPAVIKDNLNDEEALLIVTETNLMQRSFSDMLHSERAKALKAHHEALSKQGSRTDLIKEIKNLIEASEIKGEQTRSQIENRAKTLTKVGEEYKLSRNSVARYIRLTFLIDELLERVDSEQIPLIPAVSISYLTQDQQINVEQMLVENSFKVDMKKSDMLKQYAESKKLDEEKIYLILSGEIEKNKKVKNPAAIKIKPKTIQRFFTTDQKQSEIEEVIEKALELYFSAVK